MVVVLPVVAVVVAAAVVVVVVVVVGTGDGDGVGEGVGCQKWLSWDLEQRVSLRHLISSHPRIVSRIRCY